MGHKNIIRIWGLSIPTEGCEGGSTVTILTAHALEMLNTTDSPPTFIHAMGQSWIDISFVIHRLSATNYVALPEAKDLSDYELISWNIGGVNKKFTTTKRETRMVPTGSRWSPFHTTPI